MRLAQASQWVRYCAAANSYLLSKNAGSQKTLDKRPTGSGVEPVKHSDGFHPQLSLSSAHKRPTTRTPDYRACR